MLVQWTKRALKQFTEIQVYIAQDSVSNEALVSERIAKAIKLLGTAPEIGRRTRKKNTRELIVQRTGFLVVYRHTARLVTILEIRRQTRDL